MQSPATAILPATSSTAQKKPTKNPK